MDKSKDKQLSEMKDEIKEIHKIMNISASSFQFIYSSKNFHSLFLAAGIWSAVFSILYHILLMIYISHNSIPQSIMTGYYILLGIGWLFLMILRTKISMRAAKELGIQLNIISLMKELLSTKIWLAIIPVLIFFIIIPFKFSNSWVISDYIPYTGIVLGLVLNMIGVMIREMEYSIAGLWLICSGITGFLFIVMPVHIAFGLMFSPACFIFVLLAYLSKKED